MIQVSNISKIVHGHVLDVKKDSLERSLKNYDKQLYLKWNPDKNKGHGLWEIRRIPNQKTAVPKTEFQGRVWFELEYVEDDFTNHILDVPYLNYGVLNKLYDMDTWRYQSWIDEMDYQAKRKQENEISRLDSERKELIRENRKYFAELREAVRSGYNPAWFFSNHKK